MSNFLRAYRQEGDGDGDGPLTFVASTSGVKRDGLDLDQGRWRLENYERNPVVLWAHDLFGHRLPIGRAAVEVEDGALMARVEFDHEDEFAQQIERKYRRGFMKAVSVQWRNVEEEEEIFYDLLEISAVPVGADPDALLEREREALRSVRDALDALLTVVERDRGAKPPHSTAKAGEDTAWDGPREVAEAEGAEQLWMMHAWRDDELDVETKRAYKLPHHLASGEVVWRGTAAAMGRLFQAATQIPEADRRGVYNHLARHYRQFDKEPPEFRSREEIETVGPELVRGLFGEGEVETWPEVFGIEIETEPEVDPVLVRLHEIFFQEG
jgi:hypothetical protein